MVPAEGRTAAAIRPVGPADLAALSDFFAGLSVESSYLRFFAPVTPTHELLHLLSGGPANVDAIVAVADGVIVGHAMAADRGIPAVPGSPTSAWWSPTPGSAGAWARR